MNKTIIDVETVPDADGLMSSSGGGGFVTDIISGTKVKATPEEIEAVQVFAHRLLEDYGYTKDQIQTHPQYRVRIRPSDEEKSYPVDIAVFNSEKRTEDELFMIVECKRKDRKEGEHQLRLYMDMSAAEVGVWFNGNEHAYFRKIHHKDGKRTYETLPNIPRKGQRIEDIGLYKRKDLKKPSNLRAVFRDIRNHLAGMTTGITRDEALAQEVINILFCKIFDEQETNPDDMVSFRAGVGEPPKEVQTRIKEMFEHVKDVGYGDVFDESDTIKLDPDSLTYVVGELQNYSIMEADRDAIGDAFEVFIGPALRGSEGQFFTPRNVVEMMVKIVDPKPGERVIDPACGSGGFLINALAHVWGQLRKEAKCKGWTERQLTKREVDVATDCFRGIDKDQFLAKVCKAYMALIGDGRGGVFCANSLAPTTDWPIEFQNKARLSSFDVVLTNPPFGIKIPIKGEHLLSQYDLAYHWETADDGSFTKTATLKDSESPQILFIERCIQLLKPGGRLGIVLPEGVFGNRRSGYILDFLRSRGSIEAIIDCTRKLFQPHTDTKTNVLVFRKFNPNEKESSSTQVFMSVAKTCGHDKRGNPAFRGDGTSDDEIAAVAESWQRGPTASPSRLAFSKRLDSLDPYYLIPRYYSPEVEQAINQFASTTDAELVTVASLIKQKKLRISKGHEVGSAAYGTGDIPFIRTSDIANMEITHDPTFGVAESVYDEYSPKQDLHAFDLLFVNDGRYRIGQVCMLTEFDTRIVIQSHFRVLRSLDHKFLDPFLLLYLFKHPVVQLQIEAKTIIQSTIATIGPRIREIILPIPRNLCDIEQTIQRLRYIVTERAKLRAEAQQIDRASTLDLDSV
jgi:type I restriction enzyme M protein